MFRQYSRRRVLQGGAATTILSLFFPGWIWAQQDQSMDAPRAQGQTLSQLQQKLALALQHEHGAIVQYTNHCGKLAAWKLESQARTVHSIVGDEAEHAQRLVQMLYETGVEPTLAVWPPQTSNAAEQLLQQDINAEKGAISLYNEILNENVSPSMRRNIEWMLEQEIQHKGTFEKIKKKL